MAGGGRGRQGNGVQSFGEGMRERNRGGQRLVRERVLLYLSYKTSVREVGERGERWKERYDEEANKKQMELAWKKEGRRR